MAFSKRDNVGCEARSWPAPGSRSSSICELDRWPGEPHRWRPDSRTRSRTHVAPEVPSRNDRPCPLAARLAGSQPCRRSIHNAGRQPSAAGLRHRNCPAADRTAARQACGKYRGTTNTVSCYCRTREGLSCYCKLCLDNMFVAEEAFRVFMIMNKAGLGDEMETVLGYTL